MPNTQAFTTKSMTAFARQQSETPTACFVWEIKSVNHRYLEHSFRLPESFRYLEIRLRDILRSRLARGKVDVHLQFELKASEQQMHINTDKVAELLHAVNTINNQLNSNSQPSALQVLQWQGVLQQQELDTEALEKNLLDEFEKCIDQLLEARQREGEKLAALIVKRLSDISALTSKVEVLIPAIVTAQRKRLLSRMAELNLDIDPERLAQEAALFAQKIDVAEELDRLRAHITEVEQTLQSNEPCGRRLDFLMQELNREANTLASKSAQVDTSHGAVDLKVLIEQMREQVQNIE